MPLVDPFTFNPAGPFDYQLAYFLATWVRCNYYATGLAPQIGTIMGAADHWLDAGTELVPRLEGFGYTPFEQIVSIRGTTRIIEVAGEILQSGSISAAGFPGRVGIYFATAAAACWNRIKQQRPDCTSYLFTGDSLGGALAGLVSRLAANEGKAYKVYTFSAPREGNVTYALARPDALRLRVANHDDPIPRIPPFTTGTASMPVLIPTLIFSDFRHWGYPKTLFPDGSLLSPAVVDTPSAVAGAVTAGELAGLAATFAASHLIHEYAKRIRTAIPVEFPTAKQYADFPGLMELDSINDSINADWQMGWDIRGVGRGQPPRRIPGPRDKPNLPRVAPDFFEFVCE